MGEIWDLIESVSEGFPTHFCEDEEMFDKMNPMSVVGLAFSVLLCISVVVHFAFLCLSIIH